MSSNPLYPNEELRPSGNAGKRTEENGRSAFRKDYGRLLHAPAFRRLQGKTQLYPGPESDFFRNRLTHSLEVAQVARGLAGVLNGQQVPDAFPNGSISEDLVEFAAIAHDLGHPPFGHNGEHALDELMLGHGGFEGNAQTLHILSNVERKLIAVHDGTELASSFGLDLTYRSLASILKYDHLIALNRLPDPKSAEKSEVKVAKGYYMAERALVNEIKNHVAPGYPADRPFKTIECAIMDLADDIAYSTYDLEDSLHAGFLSPAKLANAASSSEIMEAVTAKVNEALLESGYEELKDGEILKTIAEAFGIEGEDDDLYVNVEGDIPVEVIQLISLTAGANQDQEFVTDGLLRGRFTSLRIGRLIQSVELIPNKEYPALSKVRLSRSALLEVEVFKRLNIELVVRSPRMAVVEYRGRGVISQIFDCFVKSRGALLPLDWQERYHEATATDELSLESVRMRVICDYIACMTDRYAIEVHARLFGEGATIFKPL